MLCYRINCEIRYENRSSTIHYPTILHKLKIHPNAEFQHLRFSLFVFRCVDLAIFFFVSLRFFCVFRFFSATKNAPVLTSLLLLLLLCWPKVWLVRFFFCSPAQFKINYSICFTLFCCIPEPNRIQTAQYNFSNAIFLLILFFFWSDKTSFWMVTFLFWVSVSAWVCFDMNINELVFLRFLQMCYFS